MALIGNRSVLNKSPGRFLNSGVATFRSEFNKHGMTRNAAFSPMAGMPSGYRSPTAWVMPKTVGALASRKAIQAAISFTGSGNYGMNQTASISMDFSVDQASMALIVGATASIPASFLVSQANLGGTQGMTASAPGATFSMLAGLSAESGLSCSIQLSFLLTGSTASAKGNMSARISSEGEGVTPQSVAREVWNTTASLYDAAGTMGNKVNAAGSAGDPWTTILPGAYGAGTAGVIIGTLQNAINSHTDAALEDIDGEVDKLAFQGAIHVNSNIGTDGTLFPLGTPAHPVRTLADARTIANANGITSYHLSGAFEADEGFTGVSIRGNTGFTADSLDLHSKVFDQCVIENLRVTSVLGVGSNNSNVFRDCYITGVSGFCGEVQRGRMEGAIGMLPGNALSVVGTVIEGDVTTIDLGNSATSVFSGDIASGSIRFINAITGSLIELNVSGGDITLDVSCTGGEYWIEGYGAFYNESAMLEKGNQLLTTVLLAEMNAAPVSVNTVQMNNTEIIGTGISTDKFRGIGEPA